MVLTTSSIHYRRRLESIKVSLENVIVKENESMVVGTIKVKNMSFNKEVIVRASWDNWKTQEDIFCTYSQVCFNFFCVLKILNVY